MNTIIAGQRGTHLLIACENRFAIVERRNGRLYNCHGGDREGVPADNLSAVGDILGDADWLDEPAARQAFAEISSRGTELAEHMR